MYANRCVEKGVWDTALSQTVPSEAAAASISATCVLLRCHECAPMAHKLNSTVCLELSNHAVHWAETRPNAGSLAIDSGATSSSVPCQEVASDDAIINRILFRVDEQSDWWTSRTSPDGISQEIRLPPPPPNRSLRPKKTPFLF